MIPSICGGNCSDSSRRVGFLKTTEMNSPEEYVYDLHLRYRKFRLLSGFEICGKCAPRKNTEKYYAMLFIEEVNGRATEEILQEESRLCPQAWKRYVHV
jgi:transcription termination factor Rho